jgi:TfoX/Sxy family transcriptional regulator of competence genes
MASTLRFVEYVCAQAVLAGDVTYKKTFGEYAIYRDEKLALVCDDHLMLKPTDEGRSLLQKPEERPPIQVRNRIN